jgi:hypothetical protein
MSFLLFPFEMELTIEQMKSEKSVELCSMVYRVKDEMLD